MLNTIITAKAIKLIEDDISEFTKNIAPKNVTRDARYSLYSRALFNGFL
jgi:hypothetical protein